MNKTDARWLSLRRVSGVVLVGATIAVVVALPGPIDSQASTVSPAREFVATNTHTLAGLEYLSVYGRGPETIVVGPDGWLYSGVKGGDIIRMRRDGSDQSVYANTGGRANGLAFDSLGQLIVADSFRGLLSIDKNGVVTVLSKSAGGEMFRFNDGVAIANDGVIWFTDASSRFTDGDYPLTILEARPSGRLLSYDPKEKSTHIHLSGLAFANGLTLGPGHDYLIISEMNAFRLLKFWISGPKPGSSEVFVDRLPGFPDDVRFNEGDLFWVTMPSRRIAIVDSIQPFPTIKNFVGKILNPIYPDTSSLLFAANAYLMAFDIDGKLVHVVDDVEGVYKTSTAALEYDGNLYIGSVAMGSIGKIQSPNNIRNQTPTN